jgi:hypothetical protein
MKSRQIDDLNASPNTMAPASSAASHSAGRKDHFLRLMLFKASAPSQSVPGPRLAEPASGAYAPLRQWAAQEGDRFQLPVPHELMRVSLDSTASEVMTDLRRVDAVTVESDMALEEATRVMIARRVRALFVVDAARHVVGIITATDVLGERPIRLAQEHGVHHDDVLIRDVMTPAERLEIVDLRDVQRARVGDIVATLRHAGRQHALAVEAVAGATDATTVVRGIFSLTQIARQLGLPAPQAHDIARTFAEIEAIIGP